MTNFIQAAQQWPINTYSGVQNGVQTPGLPTGAGQNQISSATQTQFIPQGCTDGSWLGNSLQAVLQIVCQLVGVIQSMMDKIGAILGLQSSPQSADPGLSAATGTIAAADQTSAAPAQDNAVNNACLPSSADSVLDGLLSTASALCKKSPSCSSILDLLSSILSQVVNPKDLFGDILSRVGDGIKGLFKKGASLLSKII